MPRVLALPLGFALALALGAVRLRRLHRRAAPRSTPPPVATPRRRRRRRPRPTPHDDRDHDRDGPATTTTAPATTTTPATDDHRRRPPAARRRRQPTGGAPAGCPSAVGGFIRDVPRDRLRRRRAAVATAWFDAVHGGAAPDGPIEAAGYSCNGTLAGERASVTCSGSGGTRLFHRPSPVNVVARAAARRGRSAPAAAPGRPASPGCARPRLARHPRERVGGRLAERRAVGERDGAVALREPRAVGAEHERDVRVRGRPAGPSRRCSSSWRGVVSSRSSPRTTSPTPWSASSTTTARLYAGVSSPRHSTRSSTTASTGPCRRSANATALAAGVEPQRGRAAAALALARARAALSRRQVPG